MRNELTKSSSSEASSKIQKVAFGEMIVEILDTPVIHANDLATFYATKTKQFYQYRARNAERFLPDYALQLTNGEWQSLKLQNVTSSPKHKGSRTSPWA